MVLVSIVLVLSLSTYLAPTFLVHASLASTDWPMLHHDLAHTGRSPFPGSQGNTEKWNYLTSGSVQASPAIGATGAIYVGSNDGYLYAINPDGTLKWKYNTGNIIISSPAIGSDGTVYVGSDTNSLYAINPDGTLKWKYSTGSFIRSSPAIGSDGTIYIGSTDYNVYAINPDGTLKWTFRAAYAVYSTPAINSSDGTIYIVTSGNLSAIRPDGTLKWSYAAASFAYYSSLSIGSDGTVYVGAATASGVGGGLYAIRADGTLKWSVLTGTIVYFPSIGSDGTIFVGAGDQHLYAINPDGTLMWNYAGYRGGSLAIGSDGTIYVDTLTSQYGALSAISSGGIPKWMYPTPGGDFSHPAIGSDGTIYDGNIDYNLYAINGATVIGWDLTNNGGINLMAGGSGSDTVSVTLFSGTSQPVSLSCSGLPSGASCSFNPSSRTPSFSSTLTVVTSSNTLSGSYILTVTGTNGTATAITDVFLSVVGGGTVGGFVVPIDKLALLAPYLGLAAFLGSLVTATVLLLNHRRRE